MHTFVFFLWASFSLLSGPAVAKRPLPSRKKKARNHLSVPGMSAREALQVYLLCALLALGLSFVPVVSQLVRSVPGLYSGGWFGRMAFSTCVGVIQGVLARVVVPALATKFFINQTAAFASVANLLMNCLYPALAVIYLDAKCFGHWALFWKPCRRSNAEQFDVLLYCHSYPLPHCDPPRVMGVIGARNYNLVSALHKQDICEPHHIMGRGSSTSHCMDLALLRLQDIWLTKFIMSGLIAPAAQISIGRGYTSSDEVLGKLAVLFAYATITSGHLPLIMPLLCAAALGEALVVAYSLDADILKSQIVTQDTVAPTMIIAHLASSVVHLASHARHPVVSWMVSLFIVSQMVKSTKPSARQLWRMMRRRLRSRWRRWRRRAARL